MAKSSGLGDNLYVHGVDLSGDVGSIGTLACPRAPLDVTGIDKSAVERVTGKGDPQIDFSSWFNDAANQAHPTLSALPTTDVILTYCRGTTAGNPAASLTAKQIGYDGSRGADGSLAFAVQAQGSNGAPLEWGVQITAGKINHTTGTSTASVDGGAQTTAGAACYLHVAAITGTNLVVTVEDSTDDAAWGTLKAFTSVAQASAPTAERVTVSGNVERYVRVTSSGTFSSADFAVMIRRGETVDDEAYT